jgi:hypothetical protein
MAQRVRVVKILRLTLVRRGKGSTAKHPAMRGKQVVQVVKAAPAEAVPPLHRFASGRWGS